MGPRYKYPEAGIDRKHAVEHPAGCDRPMIYGPTKRQSLDGPMLVLVGTIALTAIVR